MKKVLNPNITTYLYLVILLTYLCCQIDTGIFAVANDAMIKYLGNISSSDMRLLVTGLYVGNVIGALFCPMLFASLQAKHILVVSAIMNGIFVSFFSFLSDFWVLFASRVIVGVFEVMFEIYFPVWVDIQAPPRLQTMWISFLIVITPVGLIFGYIVTNVVMGSDQYSPDFKYVFLMEAVLMIVPCAALLAIFKPEYFSSLKESQDSSHTHST